MNDVKLPEPVFYIEWDRRAREHYLCSKRDSAIPVYTQNLLLAIHEQGRLAGLAEAAKVCETMRDHHRGSDAAAAIRALAASDGGKG
jgi:F0F1-type ATP synthase delta subunit